MPTSSPMDTGAVINPSILSNWKPDIQIPNVIGALQGGAQLQAQRLANATQALHIHLQKTQAAADIAGDAYVQMVKDPANASKIARTAIVDGMNAGLYGSQDATSQIAQLPSNPQDLLQHFGQAAGQLQSVASNLKDFVGSPSAVNTGSQQIMGRTDPVSGAFVPANAVQNQLSPAQAGQIVPMTGPNGVTQYVPQAKINATLLTNQGGPQSLLNGGVPTINGPAPTQQAPAGPPVASQLPSFRGPSTPQPVASAQTPSVPTQGPAPGYVASQAATAQAQAAQGSGWIKDATDIAPQLSSLYELGSAAKDAGTGPASSTTAMVRGLANEFGMNIGTGQATAQQVMTKASNMLITGGLSGLGQGTDEKLLTVAGATPNAKMTPMAIGTTLAMTIGQKLYSMYRGQAYQKYLDSGGSAGDAGKFGLQFQQQVSPLVLGLPYMPVQAQQKVLGYIKTLPKQAQESFGLQIANAQKNGWLNAQ